MRPGETVEEKRTVYFMLYDTDGVPCSGELGEADVFVPAAGDVQYKRNKATAYAALDETKLAHVGDGLYRFTFETANIAAANGEATMILRIKNATIRTQTVLVPLEFGPLDRRNSLMDKTVYAGKFLTSARIRVFATPAALAAATIDGPDDADGEIARFIVTGVDVGDGTVDYYSIEQVLP